MINRSFLSGSYSSSSEADLLIQNSRWNSIIRRLMTTYDTRKGEGCKPVLLLIDEAANPPIPSLDQYAATVVGRNIYLQVYIQDLAQLEGKYGKAEADTIRGNIDTWLFYRPNNLKTAEHIAERIGYKSGFARSYNRSEQQDKSSQGSSEHKVYAMTPQEIMKLKDEKIIAFHHNLPPIKMQRLDWRRHKILRNKHNLPAPELKKLPPVPKLNFEVPHQQSQTTIPYEDPYKLFSSRQRAPAQEITRGQQAGQIQLEAK